MDTILVIDFCKCLFAFSSPAQHATLRDQCRHAPVHGTRGMHRTQRVQGCTEFRDTQRAGMHSGELDALRCMRRTPMHGTHATAHDALRCRGGTTVQGAHSSAWHALRCMEFSVFACGTLRCMGRTPVQGMISTCIESSPIAWVALRCMR